jgi:hypothetical protein
VARGAGIDSSFFSKALREEGYKRLNPAQIARISSWAGLPEDYFQGGGCSRRGTK